MAFWEHRNNIITDYSVTAYLFKIFHGKCLKHLRTQAVKSNFSELSELKMKEIEIAFYNPDRNLLGSVFMHEVEELYEKAVSKLPEQCREIFIMLRYQTENYDLDFYKNRWHGEGTSNSYPSSVMSNPTTPNSYYVESGSYFRLKTVQLGYTIPQLMCKKVGVEKVRFYVNAENPLTIFGYNGFTPEVASSDPLMSGVDRGVYPLSSVYSFGVNLTF